jgi:hypothetical protein
MLDLTGVQRMTRTVTRAYTAQYSDPIAGSAGTRVRVIRQDDRYPGWWWCEAPTGHAGWVHERYVAITGDEGTLRTQYSAMELSAQLGEEVIVLEECGGWARVTDRLGRTGWLPLECLS